MEIDLFINRFEGMIEDVINNDTLSQIGEEMKSSIHNRTRLGYGVSSQGSSKATLAPLSPSYILWRSKNKGSMFSLARTSMSHLTLTGQMLSSIVYEIGHNNIILKFNNEFAQNKAQWAHDGANNRPPRPFFFLSDLDIKRVKLLLEEAFDRYLLENFNR